LKNFNFSVLVVAYLLLTGWVFTGTRSMEKFVIVAIAASPLIWMAFASQGRGIKVFVEAELKSHSMLSHAVAVACSALLLVFIMKSGIQYGAVRGPVQFFGNYRVGWDINSSVELLVLNLLLAACASTIWSGYRFSGAVAGSFAARMGKAFFAGVREPYRLLIYIYAWALLWSFGIGAVSIVWRDFNVQMLYVVTGRATVPLVLLLIIAMMRLKVFAVAVPVALGMIFYLVTINSGAAKAAVFVFVPAVVGAVLLGYRFAKAGGEEVVDAVDRTGEADEGEEVS